MKKVLVTGATENYYNLIIPYLKSIEKNSNFDENILITLDFKKEQFNKVKNCYLDNHLVVNKNPNNCLQHGEFLKSEYFKSLKDEDIICFTDGDIILQRTLSAEENILFESLKEDQVLVQVNAGHKDNLKDEFYRLSPTVKHETFENIFDTKLEQFPCYNTGVIIANLKTWNKIEKFYSFYFPKMRDYFTHYAKQQWILSYLLCKHLKPILMNYSLHCHSHHGRISNTSFAQQQLYYGNEKVLFNHFCMNSDLPLDKQGFSEQQRRYLELLCL